VVPPHDMLMNAKIGFGKTNYLANCSQNSAPYANALIHNSASHVTPNSSPISKISARYLSANTHDSALHVTSNYSRIKQNSAPYAKINAHNSASYFAHDQSQISEISARHLSTKTHDSAQPIANNCSESIKIQQWVHMQTIMIRLYILLSNQAESMKILPILEIHMAPLNGKCLHIIDRTHYTLIT
jgi:hypothetical protein